MRSVNVGAPSLKTSVHWNRFFNTGLWSTLTLQRKYSILYLTLWYFGKTCKSLVLN